MKTTLCLVLLCGAALAADVVTVMKPVKVSRSEIESNARRTADDEAATFARAAAIKADLAILAEDARTNKVSAAILRLFRALSDEAKPAAP